MLNRPLIPMVILFAGGILLGHELEPLSHNLGLVLLFLTAGFVAAGVFSPPPLRMASLFLSFFLTGILLDLAEHKPSILHSYAATHRRVTIDGTVLEPIKVVKEIGRLKVRTSMLLVDEKRIPVRENIQVSVYDQVPLLHPGERIRFPARLRPFKNFNNPGRYDYASAMSFNGLACGASVSDGRRVVPMGQGPLPLWRALVEKVQKPVRGFFEKNLEPQDYALYRALVLGERQGIGQEEREPFDRTGLGHVLAVSGLHIGLVAWVSFLLLKALFSRFYVLALKTDVRKLAALSTCIPVVAYTLVAGFQISTQRAMIMVLAYLFSLVLGREKEVWSTLALAGLCILAIDPHALFSISFQLSFAAVIGILWLTPMLFNRFPSVDESPAKGRTILNRIFLYVIGLVLVSFSATIFLLPITSLYFHRFSLVTIPANVTVVPLLGLWVLPSGLLSAFTLPFSSSIAGFFLWLGAWGLKAMIGLIHFWSDLSWSSVWVPTPTLFEMVLFYGILFLIFHFRKLHRWKLAWAVLGFLVVADAGYWIHRVRFHDSLRVTFLDVGQGNAALVEMPGGKTMLIDGGGFPRDQFDVGRMVVAPYLWRSKVLRIDTVVLSHPQADHMNGLRFIASAFHPKEFWYNGMEVDTPSFKELMVIVDSKKIRRRLPSELKMPVKIEGVEIEVLHPDPSEQSSGNSAQNKDLNNQSLVLRISYGGKSFLFPGDLEREGEDVLASRAGSRLRSHILLSPHHGSRTSSSENFLQKVGPEICVISSGEGNFAGFPHPETLERLEKIRCRVIRTDQRGAVQITVGPGRIESRTFLQGQKPR